MRVRAGIVAVGAAVLCCSPAARAADLGQRTLGDVAQTVAWQGHDTDPTGQGLNAPLQETCTDTTCDTLLLKVDLPPGTFPKGPRDPAPPGITRIHAEGPSDMPGDGVLV